MNATPSLLVRSLPRWRPRRTIGSKLLLVILPCMLLGAVVMVVAFADYARTQRIAGLTSRLDSFVATQSAALAKPLWEFDEYTVDRLARSYADVPDLLGVDVSDAHGRLVANVRGRSVEGYRNVYQRQVDLHEYTPGGDFSVGRLSVTFHDGHLRQDMAAEWRIAVIALSAAFLLLTAAVLVTVQQVVTRPLGRLRDSLRANAGAEARAPLSWTGHDELGEVIYAYNALLREIEQQNRDIHVLAYHDALTGLPNRSLLEDRLAHAIAVAERHGDGVALLFIDIDRFKVINDTLGHKVGDDLLRVVAQRLCNAVRTMDTVARWGGDEFVIVVEGAGAPGAASGICDKVLEAINLPVAIGTNLLRVSGSIGISLFPGDGAEVMTLMQNADLALYEAKGAGRNAYRFHDQQMNLRALRRLDVEEALREAIEDNQLELHYQPKIDILTGHVQGVEGLVRWRRPREGLVPPDQFIPIAEESDLIVAIGRWVLREACQQILRWQAADLGDIAVAINLSPRHLRESAEVDAIIDTVNAMGVPPHLIELELTEATVMHEPDRVTAYLWRLRDRGFSIAVDDFGTGFSNLAYLRKLPITTLKIDRSFVTDIEHDPDDAEIIRTIIAMGNTLGLAVVAEGVETAGQLEFLQQCACPVAQGYYFARPMPVAELSAWLANRGSTESPRPASPALHGFALSGLDGPLPVLSGAAGAE